MSGLSPQLAERIASVAPQLRVRFGVRSIGVFGSAARGEMRPGSDVDVLVTFAPEARITLFGFAELAEVLTAALGCPVDVVEDHPRLAPDFRAAIERDLQRVA